MSLPALAVNISAGVPAAMKTMLLSSAGIGPSYTNGTPTAFSTLQGVSRVSIYNGSAASIAFSVNTDTCTASSRDAFMVPASVGLVVENVAVHKAICVRSLSGASVSSGSIYVSAW